MTSHSDTRRFTNEDKLQAECAILRDENARLREALRLALRIAEDWIFDGARNLEMALAELDSARAALRGGEGGHG